MVAIEVSICFSMCLLSFRLLFSVADRGRIIILKTASIIFNAIWFLYMMLTIQPLLLNQITQVRCFNNCVILLFLSLFSYDNCRWWAQVWKVQYSLTNEVIAKSFQLRSCELKEKKKNFRSLCHVRLFFFLLTLFFLFC